ncbi:MAG: rRNA maturation RNase YbeY [Bacteroidales bacterium]|jgi:probable rRNA maturation factor|nr:rRNA maturation RNase YbeY [Bacteroidales bacterium]
MSINYFTEEIEFDLEEKEKITNWIINTVLQENKICGEINFILTSDKYLLDINKKYLSHNYFTDIITFSYNETNIINGDIFISIDTVNANAKRFDVLAKNELHRVIIHGILHLLAYNDQTNEEQTEMTKKENYYIDKLGNL